MLLNYKTFAIPTSYATCSIGTNDAHTLPFKLQAIAAAGFDAVELAMPDILAYSNVAGGRDVAPDDYAALAVIASKIRAEVERAGLKILMLQPFANLEGWPRGSRERELAFERLRGWVGVMEAAGTDMLQVGSSDAPGIEGASVDDMARDLAEAADILAERGFRIAYENWCWATRAPSWRDVWEVVKRANRPNLGLCLDTFQSAGGEWGDPTTSSGLLGGVSDQDKNVNESWKKSLADLAATVPADKIYLLQISDAYRMDPPLQDKSDEDGLRPRGQWSHSHRPLPCAGGYLPVRDFLNAVLDTGFEGHLSVEVFDPKGQGECGGGMNEYARRAMQSLDSLLAV